MIVTLRVFDRLDPSHNTELHGLIRRFRSGGAAAFAHVLAAARPAIENDADLAARRLLVMPVPGHEPGAASPVLSRLTMELARGIAWIVPTPPPLCRVAVVAAAKDRGVRALDQELASLRWAEEGLPSGMVLLIDDVIASGATLRACAAAIRRDGGDDRELRALVLGRANLN